MSDDSPEPLVTQEKHPAQRQPFGAIELASIISVTIGVLYGYTCLYEKAYWGHFSIGLHEVTSDIFRSIPSVFSKFFILVLFLATIPIFYSFKYPPSDKYIEPRTISAVFCSLIVAMACVAFMAMAPLWLVPILTLVHAFAVFTYHKFSDKRLSADNRSSMLLSFSLCCLGIVMLSAHGFGTTAANKIKDNGTDLIDLSGYENVQGRFRSSGLNVLYVDTERLIILDPENKNHAVVVYIEKNKPLIRYKK